MKARALALLARSLEHDIAARDNVVVGLYAEAVVALALNGALASHRWEIWDCIAEDGGTVQVKTSTGMSLGKPETSIPSAARWTGLKPGARWLLQTDDWGPVDWYADVWVLARVDGLDPFDDASWSFFVLGRDEVRSVGAQSTSASALRRKGHRQVGLSELRTEYLKVRSASL